MPKVIIHYFSATGNTKRAVDIVTKTLEKGGYQVKQVLIGTDKQEFEHADCQIFAFPVLSWAAPAFVSKYVRQLPDGQGGKIRAAVLVVHGGDPGQAPQSMERLLRRKKFDVFLTGVAQYPDNWSQMTEPPAETEALEIIATGDRMAEDFMAAFIKGERKHYKHSLLGNLISGFVFIIFTLIGRRFLGKAYIADSGCNRCELCIKTCPVKTIKMAGIIHKKPYWNFQCEDCGRCINVCPQKAIQVSLLRLFFHIYFNLSLIYASVRLAGFTMGHLPQPYRIPGAIVTLIMALAVSLVLQVTVLDRMLFILEQLPVINKIFAWGYTQDFRRYTAPGFKPLTPKD